jgi:hypothetical protein
MYGPPAQNNTVTGPKRFTPTQQTTIRGSSIVDDPP